MFFDRRSQHPIRQRIQSENVGFQCTRTTGITGTDVIVAHSRYDALDCNAACGEQAAMTSRTATAQFSGAVSQAALG